MLSVQSISRGAPLLAGALTLVACLDRPVSVEEERPADPKSSALAAQVGTNPKMDIMAFDHTNITWSSALSTGTGFTSTSSYTVSETSGPDTSFAGDVNGDGKADLITRISTSEWVYRLNSEGVFQPPVVGITGFPGTLMNQLLVADVSGDGLSDLVVQENPSGTWRVAVGTGSGFSAVYSWTSNIPTPIGAKLFAADVSGDGKADLISVVPSSTSPSYGIAHVATSTGTSFNAASQWFSIPFAWSNTQWLIADANGNGKADLIIREISTGNWRVALSTGTGFSNPSYVWLSGFAAGSNYHFLAGDVDGDLKADLIAKEKTTGTWRVSVSYTTVFGPPSVWISNFAAGTNYYYIMGANLDGV